MGLIALQYHSSIMPSYLYLDRDGLQGLEGPRPTLYISFSRTIRWKPHRCVVYNWANSNLGGKGTSTPCYMLN